MIVCLIIHSFLKGEVPFNYVVILPEEEAPFKITPSQGQLTPRETVNIDLAFHPREAAPFTATAIFRISGINRAIHMRGISKYAHITCEPSVVAFGDVLSGRTIERSFTIRNLSSVRTSFKIRRVESDCEALFALTAPSGKIGAGEAIQIKVAYSAGASGVYSSDTYEVSTPGGNTVIVRY